MRLALAVLVLCVGCRKPPSVVDAGPPPFLDLRRPVPLVRGVPLNHGGLGGLVDQELERSSEPPEIAVGLATPFRVLRSALPSSPMPILMPNIVVMRCPQGAYPMRVPRYGVVPGKDDELLSTFVLTGSADAGVFLHVERSTNHTVNIPVDDSSDDFNQAEPEEGGRLADSIATLDRAEFARLARKSLRLTPNRASAIIGPDESDPGAMAFLCEALPLVSEFFPAPSLASF